MNKRTRAETENARMIDRWQGAAYCGMGRTAFEKWAEEIGAKRRFGRSVRFDRRVIDAALDAMGEQLPAGIGE